MLATYAGTVIGLLLLVGVAVHTDLQSLERVFMAGGWPLAWLLPFRSLFFALYAIGWLLLLDSSLRTVPLSFRYTIWVTSVREAVDRLLPVASVGGSWVGLRLMRWRGHDAALIGASIVTEIVLTLIASYVFAVVGLMLLAATGSSPAEVRSVLYVLLLGLPLPVAALAILRDGSIFVLIEKVIVTLIGHRFAGGNFVEIRREVQTLLRRRMRLLLVGSLELLAMVSGSFEIWFAIRLFGHPVTISDALILESMTVGLRHIAFVIPAGLGIQEFGLVMFGRMLGIDGDIAVAVSMVKRARELLWGIPSLISWQWMEGRRLTLAALQ